MKNAVGEDNYNTLTTATVAVLTAAPAIIETGMAASGTSTSSVNRKSVPNPYGRKGGPAHQAKIASVVSEYDPSQIEFEALVMTPGGIKPYRYADFAITENGTTWYGNVGKQLKSGIPCARERYALSDIRGAGFEIKFYPYN